jgi:hypothetical protein
MAALSITRTELTVEELRSAAARQANAKVVWRVLAIAMDLAGLPVGLRRQRRR